MKNLLSLRANICEPSGDSSLLEMVKFIVQLKVPDETRKFARRGGEGEAFTDGGRGTVPLSPTWRQGGICLIVIGSRDKQETGVFCMFSWSISFGAVKPVQ